MAHAENRPLSRAGARRRAASDQRQQGARDADEHEAEEPGEKRRLHGLDPAVARMLIGEDEEPASRVGGRDRVHEPSLRGGDLVHIGLPDESAAALVHPGYGGFRRLSSSRWRRRRPRSPATRCSRSTALGASRRGPPEGQDSRSRVSVTWSWVRVIVSSWSATSAPALKNSVSHSSWANRSGSQPRRVDVRSLADRTPWE